jgi:hypothetical protein
MARALVSRNSKRQYCYFKKLLLLLMRFYVKPPIKLKSFNFEDGLMGLKITHVLQNKSLVKKKNFMLANFYLIK